jgi:tetratricopeptide (TPR) repeat protein
MPLTRSNLSSHITEYNTLIMAGRYDDAYELFCERLDIPTLQGIGEICQQRVPLLEALFPDGIEQYPAVRPVDNQIKVLHALGQTYIGGAGLPGRANKIFPLLMALVEQQGDDVMLGMSLGGYAKSLRQTGHIRQGEELARRGLMIQRKQGSSLHEATNLYRYGMGLAQRGVNDESEHVLTQATKMFQTLLAEQDHALVTGLLAQRALWMGDAESALSYAQKTWEIADGLASNSSHVDLNGIFKVRTAAARMVGEAHMLLGDLDEAETWIGTGLSTANLIHMVEEMLPILHVQTEIARQRGQFDLAQRALQATWELADTGEYVLYHADSCVMQARLYEDSGQIDEAIAAAQTAYRRAWCDGPPFAYQRGLDNARTILERLGSPLPEMPAYDEAYWSPLLEITF